MHFAGTCPGLGLPCCPAMLAAAPLRKRHHTASATAASLDTFAHGFFQRRQLERLAQDHETPFGGLHHFAVSGGEQDRDLRVAIVDLLRQRNAVHAAGHHNVAEYDADLLASL